MNWEGGFDNLWIVYSFYWVGNIVYLYIEIFVVYEELVGCGYWCLLLLFGYCGWNEIMWFLMGCCGLYKKCIIKYGYIR